MKALVISGGGNKGAWAGGYAQFLIEDLGRDYDIFTGTSTGGLLVPMLASGEVQRIRDVYCNVTQHDIFDRCPFRVEKTKDGFKTSIHHINVLRQFFDRRKTFGESRNLRKLIERTLTREIFDRIIRSNKYVVVSVANLTRDVIEYKYARDCSYEDFCDWIWLSSNMIPMMSLVAKDGYQYADGGFGDLVPIQEAINLGAKEIDVLVLQVRHRMVHYPPPANAFNLLTRGFNFMLHQIGQDDIRMSLLESRFSNVSINLIHTPRVLTDNSFIFEPELMRGWWEEGYEHARKTYSDGF